ncbi:MAG: dihydropteroate synthase [Spartobacteria bacterium]
MTALAAESRAGVVVMHMQGTPRTMQSAPRYDDVLAEVGEFFRHSLERAVASGLDPMSIALDPGIGFGKTPAHNLALLAGLKSFASLARPLLIGVSRKSLLGHLANSSAMEDRLWPGVALTALCRERGAKIFRVHEAKPHVLALRTADEDACAVGALQIRVNEVDDRREDHDLDAGGPLLLQKCERGLKHRRGTPRLCGAREHGVWLRGPGKSSHRARGTRR